MVSHRHRRSHRGCRRRRRRRRSHYHHYFNGITSSKPVGEFVDVLYLQEAQRTSLKM